MLKLVIGLSKKLLTVWHILVLLVLISIFHIKLSNSLVRQSKVVVVIVLLNTIIEGLIYIFIPDLITGLLKFLLF